MPSNDDREHFDDYRQQTEVKHEILAAYLPAFFHILKAANKNLLLIDGFGGRGTYTDAKTKAVVDGSPLRALKLIAAKPEFQQRVQTIFVEADAVLFEQLHDAVNSFYKKNPSIRKPLCLKGTFAECVNEILKEVKGSLAPTFLFVDPCGVDGTRFDTIRAVMKNDGCEAFIFFNIDGIRRIAGLDKLSNVLVELLGSQSRAQALYDELRRIEDPAKRESLILDHYRVAIREEMNAEYLVPFRVEHEDQQRTSHYLIHVSKHPLGFRIMKDVMWKRGRDEERTGALQFSQSSRTNFISLFDDRGDAVKAEILNALKSGHARVSMFYEDWSERPQDTLCESAYRQALLGLEASGKVQVLTKDGKNVVSSTGRKKWRGKSTLAKDYFVRLTPGIRT